MESPLNQRKQFIIHAIYVLLIALIVYVVFKYAIPLLSPFLIAFLIATLLRNPARRISDSTKIPEKVVSFSLVLVFYSTVGVIVALLGLKLASTLSKVVSRLPNLYESQLGPYLADTFNGIERAFYRIDPEVTGLFNESFDQFVNSLGVNVSNMSLSLVSSLSNIASSLPAFLITILIMVISTFFMAIDYDMLTSFIRRQFQQRGNEILHRTKQYMTNTLFVVIRSYLLIMSITFLELSIAFTFMGMGNAILLAFGIAIFDILPVFGTGGVMVPWTVMTVIQGEYQTAAGLFAAYVFVTIVRNIIEPKIVGGQLGLHPVVTLMSMFVGVSLLGVIGLFGFPITLSLMKHLNDEGMIKLFR